MSFQEFVTLTHKTNLKLTEDCKHCKIITISALEVLIETQ